MTLDEIKNDISLAQEQHAQDDIKMKLLNTIWNLVSLSQYLDIRSKGIEKNYAFVCKSPIRNASIEELAYLANLLSDIYIDRLA